MESQTFISDYYSMEEDNDAPDSLNCLISSMNLVIDESLCEYRERESDEFDNSNIRRIWHRTVIQRDVDNMVKLCSYIIRRVNTNYKCYNVSRADQQVIIAIRKKTYEVAILSKDRPIYDTLIELKFREIGSLLTSFCDKYQA